MRIPQTSAMSARMTGIVSVMCSSRAVGRRSPDRRRRSVYGREQPIDRGETGVQYARGHPESDSEMPLRAELDARYDHRAVLADEAIDEGHRVDRVLVAEEADRARRRWRPVQDPGMTRSPILEERPPFVYEKPCALEELLAALQCDLGERLG